MTTRSIETVCYGNSKKWTSRKKAMDFYAEAVCCCDGCEKDRYADILAQLHEGCTLCWDYMEIPEGREKEFTELFHLEEE